MRTTKRLALAISAAAIAFTMGAAHAQDATKITIASEGAYPPFNNLTPDGKLEGFDIDIGKALCEEMKAECTFVTQDWDGMIPALQADKFDAVIASMSITPERLKQVDFSKKYYNTPPGIAVPKDSDIKDVTPESLKGRTLGVQGSTSHSNFAEAKYSGSDIKMYPTADEYKLDVSNGRIDAVMDDSVVLGQWLDSDAGACCKLLGQITPDVAIHGPGAGVTVKKGNTALADKFSEAIAAIRKNGKYKEINDKYFKFDVYGAED
jgi:polar amino acid transport system substrate-binding protein